MDTLTKAEPNLPRPVLDTCATQPAEAALSLLSLLGIVLKPEEFQRQDLVRSGDRELADALDRTRSVIPSSASEDVPKLSPESAPEALRPLLAPWLSERSFHAPMLHRRLTIVIQAGPRAAGADRTPVDLEKLPEPIRGRLQKTAARYQGYLTAVTDGLPQWLSAAENDPLLKLAGMRDQAAIYALFPLLYLFSKSKNDQEKGQSAFRHFVGRHPVLTASFLAGAATTLPKLLR